MSPRCARRLPLAAGVVLGVLGGCGDDGGTSRDAGPDTPIDTPVCSGVTAFTGDIIDWDSTEVSFCGVNKAVWTVRGATACTSSTAPNGRFQLQVSHQAQTVVDVAPPSGASGCTGLSGQLYKLSAVAIASDAVIAASPQFSFVVRAMVESRVTSMFTQIGSPLATDHGQLFVHVLGTPRAVAISAAHAATQRFDGITWAAGDTGSDVLFPNVDVTGGAVSVTMTGSSVGTGSYTLEAGKLTYLTVIAN